MVDINTNMQGLVVGASAPLYAEDVESPVALSPDGSVLVAQALPELTSIVRLGGSWQAVTTTGQAALTALPTTTAGMSLNNNEPAGSTKCYAIDSFGSWEAVVDATQTDVTAIFALLNKITSAKASAGTAETSFRSLSARANYGGAGTLIRGATVVNDGWTAHGLEGGGQMAAAAAGAQWKVNSVPARGLYLVPPGGSFSIQAVKAAAAAAAQQFFFIRWHEVRLIFAT